MEKKNTEFEKNNGEGNRSIKGKDLSLIDQYILVETRLLALRKNNLLRFRSTIYDGTFILKKG